MDKDAAPRQVGEPAPDPNNNSPHPLTPHTPKLPLPAPPGFKVQTSPHLLPNQQMDSLSFPAPPAPTPTQRLRGSSGVTSAPLSCAMGHKRRRQRPSSAYSNRSGIGDKKKKKKGSRILEEENLGYNMMLKERRAVPGRGMVLQ